MNAPASRDDSAARSASRARASSALRAVLAALGASALSAALAASAASQGKTRSFEVKLDAPRSVRGVLRADLELLRWQDLQDVDAPLLRRLVADAERQAAELLASHGYFTPEVRSRIDSEAKPMRVDLEIVPGRQAQVAAVRIELTGALQETDGAGEETLAALREQWSLPVDAPFSQNAWSEAKRRAVAHVARRFPAAHVAASEARIDPEGARAELDLTIESGPPFRFGALEVSGTLRHDAARALNLTTFAAGDVYDRELLDRFQRRIAATGYFASAQVNIEAEPADVAAAPVRAQLIEAPARRIELGLGYSTDSLVRGSIEYRDSDVLARSLRFRTRIEADSLEQRGETELVFPERPGWAYSIGAQLERTRIEDLETEEISLVGRMGALLETSRPEWSATFAFSRQRANGVLSESVRALLLEYSHTWRAVDDLQSPRRGFTAQLSVGGAPPGISTRGFGRAIARGAFFQPFSPRDDFSLRSEIGAVFAGSSLGIPQSMLFRTGGSTSVRGYDFEALGVEANGAVIGGRYYGIASAEYTHWFRERLGGALFIDAGNARDSLSDIPIALGYGVGLRAASPIGPLRFDIAWGEADQTLRLHFSVGVSF